MSALAPEGALEIRLHREAARVTQVDIHSTRPFNVASIFAGRTLTQVLTLLPRVFAVCSTAQACVAAMASERALGIVPAEAHGRARSMLVQAETAREHLWRILLDWPRFLGENPATEEAAAVRVQLNALESRLYPEKDAFSPGGGRYDPDTSAVQRLADDLCAFLGRKVLGVSPMTWLRFSGESFRNWCSSDDHLAPRFLRWVQRRGYAKLGATQVNFLPSLAHQDLDRRLTSPAAMEFIARPDWCGQARETSALTRQLSQPLVAGSQQILGSGLFTRLVARLVELARICEALRLAAATLPASAAAIGAKEGGGVVGLAQVEAARGRLIHRIELVGDRVRRYQMLAPTEWNFHPQGVVASGLVGLDGSNDSILRECAELLINTIDPCVDYRLALD